MRYVISLGGNALGHDPNSQKEALTKVAPMIAHLSKAGHTIVIVHGNGPQVGMIQNAFAAAQMPMPLAECGAMSQGYIGFHLQNAIQSAAPQTACVTLVSQIEVSLEDDAFKHPTKPIGPFYSKTQAEHLSQSLNQTFIEDSGRGYRQVVPSPKPISFMEIDALKTLLNHQQIVICGGGGGIPVIRKGTLLEGVDAVIDKDFASALIAELIDADALIILTAVPYVYLNFNQPTQQALTSLTLQEAERILNTHTFAKGSMGPKLEAAYNFAKRTQKTAMIGSLEEAMDVFNGKSGTILTP